MKLKDRLQEVMDAMGWDQAQLREVSGMSSSVVSQWLGANHGKGVHSIGDLGAAIAIERASGFNALWVAKGKPPKMAPVPRWAGTRHTAAEPTPAYGAAADDAGALRHIAARLQALRPEQRDAAAAVLSAWAREGGSAAMLPALRALLQPGRP